MWDERAMFRLFVVRASIFGATCIFAFEALKWIVGLLWHHLRWQP